MAWPGADAIAGQTDADCEAVRRYERDMCSAGALSRRPPDIIWIGYRLWRRTILACHAGLGGGSETGRGEWRESRVVMFARDEDRLEAGRWPAMGTAAGEEVEMGAGLRLWPPLGLCSRTRR